MYKRKLSQIHSSSRRFLFSLYLAGLLLIDHLISRRAQVHWVGVRRRVRRPERRVTILIFLCAIVLMEPYEVAMWAAIWGGMTAIMVSLYTVVWLFPRPHIRLWEWIWEDE